MSAPTKSEFTQDQFVNECTRIARTLSNQATASAANGVSTSVEARLVIKESGRVVHESVLPAFVPRLSEENALRNELERMRLEIDCLRKQQQQQQRLQNVKPK